MPRLALRRLPASSIRRASSLARFHAVFRAEPMQGLVTVFGGTGFVGRYAVRALARAGWRIRVACRRPHLAPELRVMGEVGQIELMQANVRVPSSVDRALEGAEAVVYLVGTLWEHGPQKFDALHVEGPRTVAQAAAAVGIG